MGWTNFVALVNIHTSFGNKEAKWELKKISQSRRSEKKTWLKRSPAILIRLNIHKRLNDIHTLTSILIAPSTSFFLLLVRSLDFFPCCRNKKIFFHLCLRSFFVGVSIAHQLFRLWNIFVSIKLAMLGQFYAFSPCFSQKKGLIFKLFTRFQCFVWRVYATTVVLLLCAVLSCCMGLTAHVVLTVGYVSIGLAC